MDILLRSERLPEFDKPPVVEVVLSVQFEALAHFRTAQVGLLWQKFRQQFPKLGEEPPIPPAIERFGTSPVRIGIRFETFEVPPLARVLFINETEDQLIQVQPGRFLHNWRKNKDVTPYPRYGVICGAFLAELAIFQQFVNDENLGAVQINQCEITYVNHIEPESVWGNHGDARKILRLFAEEPNLEFLPHPEDVALQMKHTIRLDGNIVGRLHTSLQPGWRKVKSTPIYVLELTARGAPIGTGIVGAKAFFDIGHEWIVRGFKDMTTSTMHLAWEISNG
jgi:uncharacterized protein (TIGR04255 family)